MDNSRGRLRPVTCTGPTCRDRFGITADHVRQWGWLDHPDYVITKPGASC